MDPNSNEPNLGPAEDVTMTSSRRVSRPVARNQHAVIDAGMHVLVLGEGLPSGWRPAGIRQLPLGHSQKFSTQGRNSISQDQALRGWRKTAR